LLASALAVGSPVLSPADRAAAATPHYEAMVAEKRAGHAVGCEDLRYAASQGLIESVEVWWLAEVGVTCRHQHYIVMLALASRSVLRCDDVEWNAGAGRLSWDEVQHLLERLPGCRISSYAMLAALLDQGLLSCTDIDWHLGQEMLSALQAGWLYEARTATTGAACGKPVEVARRHDVGVSVGGRTLVAWQRAGSPQATRVGVAIGVIHGDEPGGRSVIDRLMSLPLPVDLELWVVSTVNPDGETAGQRGNAHGVDLNRNFPAGWVASGADPLTSGGYDSGPAPASEPEVVALMALIRRIRPDFTIWYHQPWEQVVCNVDVVGRACADYATTVGMRVERADRPGSAVGWQAAERLGAAFVVELPAAAIPGPVADQHARAVLQVHR
jgi:protein MpaA